MRACNARNVVAVIAIFFACTRVIGSPPAPPTEPDPEAEQIEDVLPRQPQDADRLALLAAGMQVDLDTGAFTFACPADQVAGSIRSEAEEGQPVDLNAIVYDQAQLTAYLSLVTGDTRCGAASYRIIGLGEDVEFTWGMDAMHLGDTLRYEDMVRLLGNRLYGQLAVSEVTITDDELLANLRRWQYPQRAAVLSPWESDCFYVLHLLGASKIPEAEPVIIAMMADPSATIQGAAIDAWVALGRRSPEGAQALLAMLGDDVHPTNEATRALARMGAGGERYLIQATTHSSAMARACAVQAFGTMDPEVGPQAVTALIAAMKDSDPTVRESAVVTIVALEIETEESLRAMIETALGQRDNASRAADAYLTGMLGRNWRRLVALQAEQSGGGRRAHLSRWSSSTYGGGVQYSPNYFEWIPEEAKSIQFLLDLGVRITLFDTGHVQNVHFDLNRHGALPDDTLGHLRNFSRLRAVQLDKTPFGDNAMQHLDGLTQIEYLWMDSPNVTDEAMVYLSSLTGLRQLSLTNSNVTDAGLAELSTLHLKSLGLEGTRITGAGLASIDSSNLTALSLAGSTVTDAGLAPLADMTQLTFLSLNDTWTTDVGMQHLACLTEMKTLRLVGTNITDDGLAHIRGMTKMVYLDTSQTAISGGGMIHLQDMYKLWELRLSGTAMTDTGLTSILEFGGVRGVIHLHLADNDITDAGMASLAQMTTLQGLALTGTAVTEEGMALLADLEVLYWLTLPLCMDRAAVKEFKRGMARTNSPTDRLP